MDSTRNSIDTDDMFNRPSLSVDEMKDGHNMKPMAIRVNQI